jgi:hypothetical protein
VQMPLTNIFLLKNTFLLASELKRGKRIWVWLGEWCVAMQGFFRCAVSMFTVWKTTGGPSGASWVIEHAVLKLRTAYERARQLL